MGTTRVGFVGMGRMGREMAGHVIDAGHPLTVWNRTPGRAADLVKRGAEEVPSAAEAARDADVVVLTLFGPDAVREVLPSVVRAGRPGLLVVDATTNGPADAREFAATAESGGARYADAPMLGTVGPARAGTLGVVAGCAAEDWPDVETVVRLWADESRVTRVGEVGTGSALKLVVNQGLGVVATGLGEALRLGSALGLDRTVVLDALAGSMYGRVVGLKREMLDRGGFSPAHFALEGLAKDLRLALDAAGDDGGLTVTGASLRHLAEAIEAGDAGADFAAVIGHVARS